MFHNGPYANESSNSVATHRIRNRCAGRLPRDMVRVPGAERRMVRGMAGAGWCPGVAGRALGKLT